MPFAGTSYRPLWVGLGQVALHLSVLVSFTFYIRRQIGTKLWRLVHFLSFATFAMSLLHGVLSGTDTANPWLLSMYRLSGLSLLALTSYRVMVAQKKQGRLASLIKT